MNRPVFSFRPNMNEPDQRKAWEILKSVPEGQKNRYMVRAILQADDAKYMEKVLREAVRDELKGIRKEDVPECGEEVPKQLLDFISMLQDE